MKICYDEEILKTKLHKDILSIETYENITFSLEHLVYGAIKNIGIQKCDLSCLMVVQETGIILAILNKEEIDGFRYIKFSQVQGVHIKDKRAYVMITLQLINGERLNIYVSKHDTKYFPCQHIHLHYIVDVFKSQNKIEMKNKSYRSQKHSHQITSLIYFITLVVLLMIPICQIQRNSHSYTFVPLIIGLGLAHFMLFYLLDIYADKTRDKSFQKEIQKILDEYKQQQDAADFYERLKNINHLPHSIHAMNQFYLCLADATYELGMDKESASYLMNVRCGFDTDLQKIVYEKQKRITHKE